MNKIGYVYIINFLNLHRPYDSFLVPVNWMYKFDIVNMEKNLQVEKDHNDDRDRHEARNEKNLAYFL